jgi:hypothetical protein
MKHDISKLCADSLRTFSNEEYNVKLKAAHAHELVAAYFGYLSKNAMLADTNCPISNLAQAKIIVMKPDDFIDQRRKNLRDLPKELPDSYSLGEAVYGPLFSNEWWDSPYPPFRSLVTAAAYLVENNETYKSAFHLYLSTGNNFEQVLVPESFKNNLLLTVYHSTKNSIGEMWCNGKTTINLPRVAGHIGFGLPEMAVEIWTGGARRTLESLGVSYEN